MIAIISREIKEISKNLKKSLDYIKKEYVKTEKSNKKTLMGEWLTDNFYLAQQEARNALNTFKSFDDILLDGNCELQAMNCCKSIVRENGVMAGQLEIENIVLNYGLSCMEIELLPSFLRASLIDFIAECISADDVKSLSNAISSLRGIYELDFESIMKKCCKLEKLLSLDGSGIYPKMSEKTKAFYRKAFLKQAKTLGVTAESIASIAKEKSQKTGSHIGRFIEQKYNLAKKGKQLLFLQCIVPLVVAVSVAVIYRKWYIAPVLFLPLWEVFRPVIEKIMLLKVKPRVLPTMEINSTVPEGAETAVVVSTLLPSKENSEQIRKKLIELKQSNGNGAVSFIILADLKASKTQHTVGDDENIKAAEQEIKRLNDEYSGGFVLAVRGREFSETQQMYTGAERKIGAIIQLVRKIKGEKSSFLSFCGDTPNIEKTKYIMALDWDSEMPLDTLPDLVSAAIHPLNKPVIENGRVVDGYGIISPSVDISLESADETVFSNIMAGNGGITAYDESLSNLYFDLFGESIFSGKGLIDVDAYYKVIINALPKEKILSHDSIESGYLRTGFLSDAQVLDSFPKSEESYFNRLHRWTRGDWQNLIYLFKRVDGKENPLNRLTKYKLFDNLRRSITPLLSVISLIISAFMPFSLSVLMLFTALLSVSSGYAVSIINTLVVGIKAMFSRSYYSNIKRDVEENIKRLAVNIIILPQTAFACTDAIVRALWRLIVSKKNLLEWTTSAESEKKSGVWETFSKQMPSLVLSVFLLLSHNPFLFISGLAFLSNLPFSLLSGKERKKKISKIKTEKQKEKLYCFAKAQWKYYEQYCNESTNWLPPDNVQETPRFDIAYRTSPTNIGMYMLCVLSARDFGFITGDEMVKRLGYALESIDKLEKWNGNLLNWYDIKKLEVLEPRYVSSVDSGNFICAITALKQGLKEYSDENKRISGIIAELEKILENTDLKPLYNKKRKLFYIGWDLATDEPTNCYYDLLMSEARMTGYYAVASRQVPKKHWGALSRMMTKAGNRVGLVSWSGTMFEYYMPHILLPVYKNSLIYEALKFCLYCQQKRAEKAEMPWGISESAFYSFDNKLNYLYKAHGVQKLGLKRGLNSEKVVSPYSTFLAMPISTQAALENLERLESIGAFGECGFYEAVDFTKSRLDFQDYAVVKSYMAHHIGMSILSISNTVFDNIMQKRFISDDKMASAKSLLQEKAVAGTAIYKPFDCTPKTKIIEREMPMATHIDEINITSPSMRLFTNGEWSVAVCDNGASSSFYNGLNMTKRSEDLFIRPQGVFAVAEKESFVMPLVKCLDQNTGTTFTADFEEKRAVLTAQKDDLRCEMSVAVNQNEPCEIRRFKVKNIGNEPFNCRLIIYLEPSLAKNSDEQAHPAFSHLFLQPSFDEESKTMLFKRSAGRGKEKTTLAAAFAEEVAFDYSFSREDILKRPLGVKSLLRKNISFNKNTVAGDCCFAVAVPLQLKADEEKVFHLLLCGAITNEEAVLRVNNIREAFSLNKLDLVTNAFGKNPIDLVTANQVLPHIFYSPDKSREFMSASRTNEKSVNALWAMGISGDNPIIYIDIYNAEDVSRALPYININKTLRLCSVKTDVVLCFNKSEEDGILSELNKFLLKEEYSYSLNSDGGVHTVIKENFSAEDINALLAFSSYIAPKTVERVSLPPMKYEQFEIMPIENSGEKTDGFEIEGGVFCYDKFVIDKEPKRPWCNVICNKQFGTLVSDMALGYTWAFNSRENKLTPWYNDIRTDNTGEMLLLRADGKIYDAVWGSTPIFSPNKAIYKGKIGAVETQVEVTVDEKALSKHIKLNLKNNSNLHFPVDAVYYTEPVLGSMKSRPHLIKSEVVDDALIMSSPFNSIVGGFMGLTVKEKPDFYCCDKKEFFSGNWENTELLPLPDGCACVGKKLKLPPRRDASIEFILSYGKKENACIKMPNIENNVQKRNKLTVNTPDKEFNYLINTWLPIQIINSRVLGRTGFYQCGGAYGFRDQLQDISSMFLLEPDIARVHILRCCSSQFEQGDVLHWWHTLPSNEEHTKGVRTRYSDDLLWLPFVVAEYVNATGDIKLLETKAPFTDGEELKQDENERYFVIRQTENRETVYEHCLKAIERSLAFGKHGLPLMKGGDWCDGFNNVGIKGSGESVWLGEFMVMVLTSFSKICNLKGDINNKEKYEKLAKELKDNIEQNAWDGEWFLRAYYDDGSKMGSRDSKCCEIDLIAQAFASLCSMPQDKTDLALNSAIQNLVDEKAGIIKLFYPPFKEGDKNAGYVNAYPQGVRENAGQYTHAAVWFCLALIKADRTDEAYKYLKMINPINKYRDYKKAEKYAAEPYALTGDVYSAENDAGKAGWSHYTGSAAWYYKCVVESLLGIKQFNGNIKLEPKLPSKWLGYTATLEIDGTVIDIEVKSGSEELLLVDSERADFIPLDGKNHKAVLII